jgi:hypothetical protein
MTASDYKTMRIATVGDNVKQACEPCYKIARNVYRELIVQNRMLSWHFYALVAIICYWNGLNPSTSDQEPFPSRLFSIFSGLSKMLSG